MVRARSYTHLTLEKREPAKRIPIGRVDRVDTLKKGAVAPLVGSR
jgi:hypothetical protein